MTEIILEVCVDSIESALAAQEGGAQRIELCASLLEGGLTPSAATIELARQKLTLGMMVMIRPRGGDFLYSDLDVAIMLRDIEIAKQAGADGVVFGLLTEDGKIDRKRTQTLADAARPLQVTFHRAFDHVADPATALETLIEIGVDRVLTSGQEATAAGGVATIAKLIQQAAGRISIMPGGGINETNIAQIARATGARELHMSGRTEIESNMRHRNPRATLGAPSPTSEYSRQVTSAARIRASLDAVRANLA